MQSRYYNPETSRFLNADAFTATGQGCLGNNMFAYCLNSPLNYEDSTGQRAVLNDRDCVASGAVVGFGTFVLSDVVASGAAALGTLIDNAGKKISTVFSTAKKEVYSFSQMLRQELAEIPKKAPNVHHIVPIGNFSRRTDETVAMISEMHNMLNNADINRYIDPMNLMLVSAGTHAKLHTDAYIAHVYSYISSTNGSREEIYGALFFLRLEIAAWDVLATGY